MDLEVLHLLRKRAILPILALLYRHGTQRFADLVKGSGASAGAVERALAALQDGEWIEVAGEQGPQVRRGQVVYRLSSRGVELLAALRASGHLRTLDRLSDPHRRHADRVAVS